MPNRFSTGVKVIRDEPEAIESALMDYVRGLRSRHPEISRILWFGSRVRGTPTRASDVDLCLILTETDRSFLDRISFYHPGRFPTGIDLFPYTVEEFAQLQSTTPGWTREILTGREL